MASFGILHRRGHDSAGPSSADTPVTASALTGYVAPPNAPRRTRHRDR